MSELQIDSNRQIEAKRYALIRRRLFLVDLILTGIYTSAWLIFGWSRSLEEFFLEYISNEGLLVLVFVAVFGCIYYVIDLPPSFFSGFILPHRFGLSTQTKVGWLIDKIKGLLVGGILGIALLEIFYAIMRTYPDTWWVLAAVLMVLINVVIAKLAPVLLFPIFYQFYPLDEENKGLIDRLTHLAERAGTQVTGVYKFDLSRRTTAANAALVGSGNTRRILLGDTLMDEFSDDEIETILAHELGHHVHKDIPMGIVVDSLLTFFGLYLVSLGLKWGAELFNLAAASDVASFPVLILVIGAFGLLTMPLSNAYSRWRERSADAYAVYMTGKGDVYASALTRLANKNLSEVDPEPWVELLLYSHPALGKRISMARNYKHPSKG